MPPSFAPVVYWLCGAAILALVCIQIGYRWGVKDTRLALSKPARRLAAIHRIASR